MFVGGFELSDIFNNNIITHFFSSIEEGITSNLSFVNNALNIVIELLNYLSNIVVWLSSYSGLTVSTVYIIFGLIGAGFGIIISTFMIKLIVKWWSAIIP